MLSSSLAGDWALVRAAGAGAPLAARAHVAVRFLTCPMRRVLAHVPPGARLLDLGAGHGLFGLLAAARGARVVALDPDRRKVLAGLRHPRLRRVAGYLDAVAGAFEVVALLDVLYRVPLAERDGFLAGARDRLVPGGLLLIKELDPERRFKHAWNRFQERWADRLGLTLGDAFVYETRAELGARLARLGFVGFETHDVGRGYPHAHVVYLARRDV